ncbi:hypothetical protein SAY86_012467 [Trapa natans]|uniref:Cyclin N-terminal domain-containing protein n=1 Tax=Trapa natans TaxID=22666 RepID=A0AAN7LS79_TRANT|nr:hypothetical protein SAY86_012467 [Trapa natans]
MAPPHTEELSASSLFPGEGADEAVSPDLDYQIYGHPSQPQWQSHILHQPLSDEAAVGDLIDCESQTLPQADYLRRCRSRSVNLTARQDSISWILKVHAHYHFQPVTAMLAVNYLDRFLSAHSHRGMEDGWSFQLLSVACLSMAAKMEEMYVPLLLDLQICEPKFLFEPKTVQRMELCVMANLDWRLRSVTPFDFIHLFISKMVALPSSSSSAGPNPSAASRIISLATDLIMRTLRVIDFLGFPPSAIAAAAVLSTAGEGPESPVAFHERVDKEMVRSCHQLMEEYLLDTFPTTEEVKATDSAPAAGQPLSPVGVLDASACGSCDTRSENRETEQPRPTKRMRSSAPDVQEP